MSVDRVCVYTTNRMFEAEIIRKILADNSINAFILNKMDSSYRFGEIEILVKGEDVMRSKLLIREYEDQ